eukprot:COSAG01_NODE_124_length_25180_cov_12.776112_10_plen_103_part_00
MREDQASGRHDVHAAAEKAWRDDEEGPTRRVAPGLGLGRRGYAIPHHAACVAARCADVALHRLGNFQLQCGVARAVPHSQQGPVHAELAVGPRQGHRSRPRR